MYQTEQPILAIVADDMTNVATQRTSPDGHGSARQRRRLRDSRKKR